MKVLVACEYSGRVRDAFLAKGHDAISCDFHPTEVPGPHYQGDVRDILYDKWDLIIAHPDCTYLTNAGVRWLYENSSAGKAYDRWEKMRDAVDFFNLFLNHPTCQHICVENPIPHGHASRIMRRDYSQTIQPYQFGEPTTKRTCLWLENLPLLKDTNNVKEEMMKLPYGERAKVHYASPGPGRWKERSRSPQSIANAMAEQWSYVAT